MCHGWSGLATLVRREVGGDAHAVCGWLQWPTRQKQEAECRRTTTKINRGERDATKILETMRNGGYFKIRRACRTRAGEDADADADAAAETLWRGA